jgi:hypothetical protein
MPFPLPGISDAERGEVMVGVAVVNHAQDTVLSIPKRAVLNLVLYAETGGGEVVFALETGSADRPWVFYSALVTEPVYRAVRACLD